MAYLTVRASIASSVVMNSAQQNSKADVKADSAITCRHMLAITAATVDVEWWCARTEEMVRKHSGLEEREVPPDGRGSPTPSVWSQIGRRGGAGARAAVEST
jgi:hypothetical protein